MDLALATYVTKSTVVGDDSRATGVGESSAGT